MPGEITVTLETFVVIVGGAVMVAYLLEGTADWRFFIIDAEAMGE